MTALGSIRLEDRRSPAPSRVGRSGMQIRYARTTGQIDHESIDQSPPERHNETIDLVDCDSL